MHHPRAQSNAYNSYSRRADSHQQNTKVGELPGASILAALPAPTTRASASASNWQNNEVTVAWWPPAAAPLVCTRFKSSA